MHEWLKYLFHKISFLKGQFLLPGTPERQNRGRRGQPFVEAILGAVYMIPLYWDATKRGIVLIY